MEVVYREEMFVTGLLVHAPLQRLGDEVPKAWRHLFERAAELEELRIESFIDVCMGVVDSKYLQLVGGRIHKVEHIPKGLTAVHILAQGLLHHRHIGPATGIANTFGDMYAWGERNGLTPGEFKLDIGYTLDGKETEHDLYVGLWPRALCRLIDAN